VSKAQSPALGRRNRFASASHSGVSSPAGRTGQRPASERGAGGATAAQFLPQGSDSTVRLPRPGEQLRQSATLICFLLRSKALR
jgi:hypothetical protein